MTDTQTKPYSEDNPDHVPNPLHQSGVVDTTGTTGDLGGRIETISPIFAKAKADAFGGAVAAIDDPLVNEDEVIVFHEEENPSREEQEQRIRDAAEETKEAAESGLSPAQAEAARSSEDENGGQGDGGSEDESGEVSFSSKREAEEYADAHTLDVDKSLKAEEYKAAVAKAANSKA